MKMDTTSLNRAFRNTWIMVVVVTALILGFFALTLTVSKDAPRSTWDMGGVSFVPASSTYGNGYYVPEPEVKGAAE
jgi:hypothetical protein